MNKGVITKISKEKNGKNQKVVLNIRLDRNVEINDNQKYNLYIDLNNKKACLFNYNARCICDFDMIFICSSNKFSFDLDFSKYIIDDNNGYIIIKSISYEQ